MPWGMRIFLASSSRTFLPVGSGYRLISASLKASASSLRISGGRRYGFSIASSLTMPAASLT